MRTVEWVPGAELVEHDEEVVSRVSIKAWHVGASEWVTSDAVLQNHGDGAFQLAKSR